MIKTLNIFFILLVTTSGFAFSQQKSNQNFLHLTIVDGSTLRGIDKVTVAINKKRIFFTDSNGSININKTSFNPLDSLVISCVGYQSVLLAPPINFNNLDTVRLSASLTELNEIEVYSSKLAEVTLGDIKKRYNTHRVPNTDEEFAQYIPNDKKIKGIIVSVTYVLNDQLHGIDKPFAVRLYSKSKVSLFPDKELIKDSIIVYNPKKDNRVIVDISKYHIPFPDNGVIAVFATLPQSYYKKDSVFYDAGALHGKSWRLKMPGIDMDLKRKDDYPADYDKQDRNVPYSMVRPGADKLNFDDIKDQFYVFTDGNNLAITITIRQ